MRRAHASTPPKPDSETVAKATNSSARLGRGRCGAGGEDEIEDLIDGLHFGSTNLR